MRLHSLALKLNLALLVFFIVLGGATAGFIYFGFDRTRSNATARSEEALADLGADILQYVAYTQADYGATAMEWAQELGHRAGRYMEQFKATGTTPPLDLARLVQTADGVWYDPVPERVSDVVVVNHPTLDGAARDAISYSAALDALFPALLEGYPGEWGGQPYYPITIVFVGPEGVGRTYPPMSGIEATAPQDFDAAAFVEKFGPARNPERRSIWTIPYEDRLGKGLVITAQTPVYEGNAFRGVFEVDLSIENLIGVVDAIKPTESGFAFYVDKEGGIMKTASHGLLTRELERGNQVLAAVIERMKVGEPGVGRVSLDGREFYLASAPMQGLGGGFAVVAPISELTAEAAAITAEIDDQADRTLLLVLCAMTALFAVALVGATYLNRRVLVRPIEALAGATQSVAQGDFETRIDVSGDDELAELGRSFNRMTADIQREVQERENAQQELAALFSAMTDVVIVFNREGRCLRIAPTNPDLLYAPPESVTGRLLSEIMPAEQAERFVEGIQAALTERRAILIEYPMQIRDREMWFAATISPMSQDSVVYVARDITDRVNARQDLERQVEARTREVIEQAQQLAAVEERQRLARELHDSVSQALYGIALGARTASTLIKTDPARAAEPVSYVLSLAEAGLAEMRALIFELRPESLETEGLVAAIQKQTDAMRARYSINVETQLGEEPPLPIKQKEVLYRVAQEALHNIVKHAHASEVNVTLQAESSTITLKVRDDGLGFNPDQGFAGHIGLVSMRERAKTIGGNVTIQSRPGAGTTVKLEIPTDLKIGT